jgi:hypothetical protein
MMAIYNREHLTSMEDFMMSIEFLADPLLMQDAFVPQDGKEHADSWGSIKVTNRVHLSDLRILIPTTRN